MDKTIYEPHPVTPERKAELRGQGFRIIDAVFKPEGVDAGVDASADAPPEIPEGWAALHHATRVKLAKAISGSDQVATADEANMIISAEVARRASEQPEG